MRRRDEQGSTSLELAISCPLLALLGALGVQVAIWSHAQDVAQAAAQQGARATADADGRPVDGQARTRDYLTILGPRLLRDVRVSSSQDSTVARVEIRGTVVSIVPGLTLRVHETAHQQREQFHPDQP